MPKPSDDQHPLARSQSSRWVTALLFGLLVMTGAFAVGVHEPQDVAAQWSSKLGPDADADGLADTVEYLIGTNPDQRDTDNDGFHDLEEVTRHSDPLVTASVPQDADISVGMYSYLEDGVLNMHTAIFVEEGDSSGLRQEYGFVFDGQPVRLARVVAKRVTQYFQYSGLNDPNDKLLVLEMPIPASMFMRLGTVSMYSRVWDESAHKRAPAIDASDFTLVDGDLMEIIDTPPAVRNGRGIVYRPLTGEGTVPSNSKTGEICWQDLVPAGVEGAFIVYEIEQASCEDFDSACNPSYCANSSGGVVRRADVGGLLGG